MEEIATEEVAMPFTREAGERAMRVHEVILRGLSGELTWLQVADILGRSPRSIRRLHSSTERDIFLLYVPRRSIRFRPSSASRA